MQFIIKRFTRSFSLHSFQRYSFSNFQLAALKEKYFKEQDQVLRVQTLIELVKLRQEHESPYSVDSMLEKAELAKNYIEGLVEADLSLIPEIFEDNILKKISFKEMNLQDYPRGYQNYLIQHLSSVIAQSKLVFKGKELSARELDEISTQYRQAIDQSHTFVMNQLVGIVEEFKAQIAYDQQIAAYYEMMSKIAKDDITALNHLNDSLQYLEKCYRKLEEALQKENSNVDVTKFAQYQKDTVMIKQVFAYEKMADIYINSQRDLLKGRHYLELALSIYKELEGEDSYQYIECYSDLCYTYLRTEDLEKGFQLIEQLYKQVEHLTHLQSTLQVHIIYFKFLMALQKDPLNLYEKIEIISKFTKLSNINLTFEVYSLQYQYQTTAISYLIQQQQFDKIPKHLAIIRELKNVSHPLKQKNLNELLNQLNDSNQNGLIQEIQLILSN